MNTIYHIFDADLRNVEDLLKARAGEKLAVPEFFLLSDPPYNLRRSSKLGNISHDVFESNVVDYFCDLATTLIKPVGYGRVFF